jgi:hypothetical protein
VTEQRHMDWLGLLNGNKDTGLHGTSTNWMNVLRIIENVRSAVNKLRH